MLKQIFSQFSVVGFSGARRAPNWSLDAMSSAASSVSSGCSVRVGCANGVDSFFRDLPLAVSSAYRFPRAQVFSIAGHHRSDFAARSITCVKSVADDAGLWVAFPSSASPPSLVPSSRSSRCFCGSGSGTWASLALAVGLGVPCLVYLGELPLPVGWSFSPVAGCPGWFSSGLAAGSLVASPPCGAALVVLINKKAAGEVRPLPYQYLLFLFNICLVHACLQQDIPTFLTIV